MLKPILALPAAQFCVRGRVVRSSKRQRTDSFTSPSRQIRNCIDKRRIQTLTDSLACTPVSVGLDTKDRLMNSEGESPSFLMTTAPKTPEVSPQQQHATNYTSSVVKNGARSHSENCTSIVPHPSTLPISSLLDAAPPILTMTRSLLAAVSNYMNSSKPAKRRHSPDERSNCCLCHSSEDDSDRTAIHTLEELKAFVRNDVAEMLRPILDGISKLKMNLEKNSREQQEEPLPWGKQPAALQMVCGDVRIADDGTFMSPGSSSVLTSDSRFPFAQQQHSQRSHPATVNAQADQMCIKLPMLVEEFPVNPIEAQTTAEPDWYSEKLREKNREIEALQATVFDLNREIEALQASVYDLVGYQQKITVEFEKVKRYLCNEVAQGRLSSSSSFLDGQTTYLDLLVSTFKAVMVALECFTANFLAYSEARSHVPANKIWKPNFRDVYLAKESHWTFALMAFFFEKMFVGFENESFMTDAASLHLDPAKLRKESYAYFKRASSVESSSALSCADAHFRTYCEQKFDSIVPDAILLQPGDYDEDDMGESSFPALAEINLSKSFTAAAMKVWTLHKLCLAFEPAANIFRPRRGLDVDWTYMESVVRLEDDERFISKVGFMIAPGFRLRNSTVKSQIYLASRATASPVGIHGHLPV